MSRADRTFHVIKTMSGTANEAWTSAFERVRCTFNSRRSWPPLEVGSFGAQMRTLVFESCTYCQPQVVH